MTPECGPAILLVEDNADNALLVQELAEELGVRLLAARDGVAGLALARSERPAVVLLDLSLPGLDGWEVARRLKADPGMRGVPVVALTAHAMAGDEEKARAAGCDAYLSKPIDIRVLQQVLENALKEGAPHGEWS